MTAPSADDRVVVDIRIIYTKKPPAIATAIKRNNICSIVSCPRTEEIHITVNKTLALWGTALINRNTSHDVKLSDIGSMYPELKPLFSKIDVDELYPTQEEAIKRGALEKSFLLASGTASGKTLVAILAASRKVLEGKKVLYLAPLRSLAFEKYSDFKKLPFRTAISVGEMDSSDPWLKKFDIIVATYEKAESLIRHQPDWLKDIGLVVFDEVHEMGRKPLIETLAVKFGWTQMLMLSATIGNVEELAEWLDIEFLESDFRPVPLREGVLKSTVIEWGDSEEPLKSKTYGQDGVIEDGLVRQHQTLIFTNTRRSAEAIGNRAAVFTHEFLTDDETKKLAKVAEKLESALDYPTKQCKKLAMLVRQGAAFHHAGLVNEQRIAVESAFRDGLIKTLGSTVTLVAGLNLPSRRVVIKTPSFMGEPWPVSLYKQAAGRSGRPGYDEAGESIILHKNPEFARDYFINGEVESIKSPLAYEPTLRQEIIGLFASGFAASRKDVASFMKKTFYTFQYGESDRIVDMGLRVIDKLVKWKMLQGDDMLTPTKLGRRVAEVYIDPQTAIIWLEKFESTSPLGYMHLMGMGHEIRLPNLRSSEADDLRYSLISRGEELTYPRPEPWDIDFEKYMKSFKLAMILEDWIDEKSEEYILNRFGMAPGDLRNHIRNTEWLSYAMNRVIEVVKGNRRDLSKLAKRVKHGVRSELVDLAELPGIGRTKARRLYSERISVGKLLDVPVEKLSRLVGKETARRLRDKLTKNKNPRHPG